MKLGQLTLRVMGPLSAGPMMAPWIVRAARRLRLELQIRRIGREVESFLRGAV